MKPKIAIIMGSPSNFSVVAKALNILDELKIPYASKICSAYRTPDELDAYISTINQCDECKVIIAAAGKSAALAGRIASKSSKPVIGIPLSENTLDGLDALLASIQMPVGIPVLSVGIDASENAALAAAEIIAVSEKGIANELVKFRSSKALIVITADEQLQDKSMRYVNSANLKYQCNF